MDVQGFRAVARGYRDRRVSVFLMPPNQEELALWLHHRDGSSRSTLAVRTAAVEGELQVASEFDHLIQNGDFEATLAQLEQIVAVKNGPDFRIRTCCEVEEHSTDRLMN